MRRLPLVLVFAILLVSVAFLRVNVKPAKGSLSGPRVFRLLAIEQMFDSHYMRSAQFFIKELLQYPNWNNSTDDYVSYIHLLSMYDYDEVDDEVKPFWVDTLYRVFLKDEIISFLGQASPGEIIILYYCGHSHIVTHPPPPDSEFLGISQEELREWVHETLSKAYLSLILDTCYSGYWINFSPKSSVLAAAGKSQFAWGGDVGVFTLGLAEAFAAKNDSNNDGWLALGEAFPLAKNYTETEVTWATQTPECFYNVAEGDLPLVQIDEAKEFPLWDIAVINVTSDVPDSRIDPKSTITVNASLENRGIKPATVNVVLYMNTSNSTIHQLTLQPAENSTVTFTWNASAVYGICVLNFTIVADYCPGELAIFDNIRHLHQRVTIALRTDLNYDRTVGIDDIVHAAEAFGSYEGHSRWNPMYDLDSDRRIRIMDLLWIASDFGKTYH